MNIFLVSECSGRALNETRRVLDQFAERRGERTWQTAITENGLDTLKRLLRATARKNTAVACHWIRSKNHTELLWIVGNATRFNAEGVVPTNRTERNILRAKDENDWHSGELIRLLAAMAALMHDLGKASRAFQAKLKPGAPPGRTDYYRHEWVSLRLFQALIRGAQDDRSWLERLATWAAAPDAGWMGRLKGLRDSEDNPGAPFLTLPPIARAIGWLVLTHHRLPDHKGVAYEAFEDVSTHLAASWTSIWPDAKADDCWLFPHELPDHSAPWRDAVAKLAALMVKHLSALERLAPMTDPYLMHLSRLALVLADHHFSGLPITKTPWTPSGYKAYANTDKSGLKQLLDQHLCGVRDGASRVVRALPRLRDELPRLAKIREFRKRAASERFRWQDQAFDLSTGLARASAEHGFFGINMASTGCGKTLANARILYGLAEGSPGARFSIALGLRTLTLQTGDALRQRIFGSTEGGKDQVAVLVGGGRAVRDLHADARSAVIGSESAEPLLEPSTSVQGVVGFVAKGPLSEWLHAQGDRTAELVEAPILISTIDHLMPASECTRGGHQIAPILRLLTSDLVLDEVDDYDLADLPAVSRLVHLAGVFGARVLLSSATLPPSLVRGLFEAYRAGRAVFQRHRGRPSLPVNIRCGWFDEFGCVDAHCPDEAAFASAHVRFVEARVAKLDGQPSRQRGTIIEVNKPPKPRDDLACEALLGAILKAIPRLHADNGTVDPETGKRISIGVVRMANVDPLIKVAREWFRRGAGVPDAQVHLCVYHARHPLLMRAAIERELDQLLKRGDAQWLQRPALRTALATSNAPHHVLVVLASPVVEVGRDHDYDWAIAEPSSMRSLIQLAGRVRRHRREAWTHPNVAILQFNVKRLMGNKVCFTRPGFEDKDHQLATWNMAKLLAADEYQQVRATPRIIEPATLQPKDRLVDLEHQRLRELMVDPPKPNEKSVRRYWTSQSWLTGFPARDERFRKGAEELQFWLTENDNGALRLRMDDDGITRDGPPIRPFQLRIHPGITPWLAVDYLAERERLAAAQGIDIETCERRFGTISLRKQAGARECAWNQIAYESSLGFWEHEM